jgi:phage terminase small subunit
MSNKRAIRGKSDMTTKLTAKQARFVEEYLCDLNATQAAIRAGDSPDGEHHE